MLWNSVPAQLAKENKRFIYKDVQKNMRAEVDFLVEMCMSVIPIEVKAELNLQAKSLKTYCTKHTPPVAVRMSMQNYLQQDTGATPLLNLPLYAVCTFVQECQNIIGF